MMLLRVSQLKLFLQGEKEKGREEEREKEGKLKHQWRNHWYEFISLTCSFQCLFLFTKEFKGNLGSHTKVFKDFS